MDAHVCDPPNICPPWAHPYPGTAALLHRQNAEAEAALAERQHAARSAPRKRPARPVSVAQRHADALLSALEQLTGRGYVLTDDQATRLRAMMMVEMNTEPGRAAG